MSPFAGEGANLAMYDGALLAAAIASNPGNFEAALIDYETDLFPRSAKVAAETDRNLKLFFDDKAPKALLTCSPTTIAANRSSITSEY